MFISIKSLESENIYVTSNAELLKYFRKHSFNFLIFLEICQAINKFKF